MDSPTPTPDVAQPQGDGQDNGTGSATPWNLDAHPEELRPYLAEELKKIESGITPKLQEAAELRKQFGPLQEIEGLTDVPAEELAELIQFRQLIQDPQQFEEWWSSIGEELGFFAGDDDDSASGDEAAAPSDDEPPAWAQSLMERLDQLEGGHRQSEAERREAQALQHIESEVNALREQHGDFDEDAVLNLAMAFDGPDAIKQGFAEYQRITGKAQSELVDSKESTAGGTPVSGGSPNTTQEPVQGFGEAKKLAKARFAGAR